MEKLISTITTFFRERYQTHFVAVGSIRPGETLNYQEGENRIQFKREPGGIKVTITLNTFRNPEDVFATCFAEESDEVVRAKLLKLVQMESPTAVKHLENFEAYAADARNNPMEFHAQRHSDKDGMTLLVQCVRGSLTFDDEFAHTSNIEWIKFCLANDAVWAIGYRSQIEACLSKLS